MIFCYWNIKLKQFLCLNVNTCTRLTPPFYFLVNENQDPSNLRWSRATSALYISMWRLWTHCTHQTGYPWEDSAPLIEINMTGRQAWSSLWTEGRRQWETQGGLNKMMDRWMDGWMKDQATWWRDLAQIGKWAVNHYVQERSTLAGCVPREFT